jgi:Zn finger protein HypA/HybF involved in hydrogenase expression
MSEEDDRTARQKCQECFDYMEEHGMDYNYICSNCGIHYYIVEDRLA